MKNATSLSDLTKKEEITFQERLAREVIDKVVKVSGKKLKKLNGDNAEEIFSEITRGICLSLTSIAGYFKIEDFSVEGEVSGGGQEIADKYSVKIDIRKTVSEKRN